MQSVLAKGFCSEQNGKKLSKDSDSITSLYSDHPVVYQYSVSWIPDCSLETEQLIDDESCEDIMIGNFRNCNNGGKGGESRDGCVLYAYRSNTVIGPNTD
jgi:hypothetical protein